MALRKLCWETMFGQELVKLTIMDTLFLLLSVLIGDFFRSTFLRYRRTTFPVPSCSVKPIIMTHSSSSSRFSLDKLTIMDTLFLLLSVLVGDFFRSTFLRYKHTFASCTVKQMKPINMDALLASLSYSDNCLHATQGCQIPASLSCHS
jgi:hypothetical protein